MDISKLNEGLTAVVQKVKHQIFLDFFELNQATLKVSAIKYAILGT